jgi:hypothetical protein
MGWAFNNCLAAANEATKNLKIKIRRGLRWLQNDVRNTTINQKRAASMEERWDVTSEQWGVQGECNSIIFGVNELGRGVET